MRNIRNGVAAVCLVALAGCGGDGGGATDGEADAGIREALADEMLSEADSPVETEEQARCWSGTIVDGVGEERLRALGVTVGDVGSLDDIAFEPDEIDVVVDGLFDCVDVESAFARQFEADFGAEGGACIAEAMDRDMVKTMMRSSLSADEGDALPVEFLESFFALVEQCGVPLE